MKKRQRFKRSDSDGYIYVLSCGPFTKIGFSSQHPSISRLPSIQAYNPYEISLVTTKRVRRAFDEEQRLHIKFSADWLRGEWFTLSEASIADLMAEVATLPEIIDDLQKEMKTPRLASKQRHYPDAPYGVYLLRQHYVNNTGPFSPEEVKKYVRCRTPA